MRRLVSSIALALLAAACGEKTFPSLCKDEVPPPAACMSDCDPKPGSPETCPSGFHCNPDGKCDAQCVPGEDQCGPGYTCLPDGTCINNDSCSDPACKIVDCKAKNLPETTISGTVFAPNGTLPLYGINVYVPDKDPGPVPDGLACNRCTDTLPGSPIGSPVITDEMGKFTLTKMPSGVPINLVITSGKWRRIVKLTPNECADNPIAAADTTLPKSADDMSPNTVSVAMPKIALTTGSADSLECLVRKLGIADKEITTSGGAGHVHFYKGNGVGKFDGSFAGGGGQSFTNAMNFWDDQAKLSNYDIVILSCEGGQHPETKPQSSIEAMKAYADAGGRVFASHWHNVWIGGGWNSGGTPAGDPVWNAIANWNDANDPGTTDLIDEQSNPKGPSFATWMLNVGGSTTRDQIVLQSGTDRSTCNSLDPNKAQRWTYTSSGNQPQNFQFVTPNEGDPTQACGKVVFSDMHVSGGPGSGDYPTSCGSSLDLTPQEKALAFMFFDISSCVGNFF